MSLLDSMINDIRELYYDCFEAGYTDTNIREAWFAVISNFDKLIKEDNK